MIFVCEARIIDLSQVSVICYVADKHIVWSF